ncbi:hypothetical protein [Amycolatopsis taiwanensis]|uniref:hypothetical protein n=1 Tax=Amycolatopsis taiwanensis TaxID=342230 RepID=UPI0004898B89|nr:hypothetical protein [Amycolatopsis taiwanensis]
MTYPAIPDGRPRTPPDLAAEVARLQRQVAELTRRGPVPTLLPVCRIKLNVNVPMSAGIDMWAQGNWVVGEDPDGLFTAGGTSANPNSFVRIQKTARYLVSVTGLFSGVPVNATCVAFAALGAPNPNNSITRDPRNSSNAGSDGVTPHAWRGRVLNAGDLIYWGHWASTTCTLNATSFTVPTEFSLYWLGPR